MWLCGHVRPVAAYSGVEHGPDAPARAEDVEGLGEAVVVDDARIDGEQAHQEDDVAARKHHAEHLAETHGRTDRGTQNK